MNIQNMRTVGLSMVAASVLAACSDVVDIPGYNPYESNGAPVIEAIYDAQDTAAAPAMLNGGVLDQMIKIKGQNLSHVKSVTFNNLPVDVRHDVYAESDCAWITIPRQIPETVTDTMVFTTEQGSVSRYFPVTIPALTIDGLKNEFVQPGNKIQVSGANFDLYGFADTTATSTSKITIRNEAQGYVKEIKTDSITEKYMGIKLPMDIPENSTITFDWDSMGVACTKTIAYRMTDQLMFGNFDGDLGWWNDWFSTQLTDGTAAGDPESLGYTFVRITKDMNGNSSFESWGWNSTGFGCNWRWFDASAHPENYVLKFEVCTASSKPFYDYGDNGKNGAKNGGYNITFNGGDQGRNQWDPVSDGLTNTYGAWVTVRIPLVDVLKGLELPTEEDKYVGLEFVCQPNTSEAWIVDHSFGQFRIEPKNY